jgi:hypothetical protein
MTTMTDAHGRSALPVGFLALSVLVLAAVAMPGVAPHLEQIKQREHAVERHGSAALTARAAVRACDNLKIYQCPASKRGPRSWAYVCETDAGMCAVVWVGSLGGELTAYPCPCSRLWSRLANCEPTEIER